MTASMWMQFLNEMGYPVTGFDTDPSNHTFADFTELGVTHVDVVDENDEIDQRRFDNLVETICRQKTDEHIIIDTGSSCFQSLFSYLKHNKPFDLLKSCGHQIYAHTLIAGGGDFAHTTTSLVALVKEFPDIPFIVWKNRYHGELSFNNQTFEQLDYYPIVKDHIKATINIPLKNAKTFGADIEYLMATKLTFRSAGKSSMPMMVQQRLNLFWLELCEAMKEGLVFDKPAKKAKEA